MFEQAPQTAHVARCMRVRACMHVSRAQMSMVVVVVMFSLAIANFKVKYSNRLDFHRALAVDAPRPSKPFVLAERQ